MATNDTFTCIFGWALSRVVMSNLSLECLFGEDCWAGTAGGVALFFGSIVHWLVLCKVLQHRRHPILGIEVTRLYEMFVRMLTVHCDQNNRYEITINGFQVRKINEIRNVIFGLRYGKHSSALRPKLGCSPSWVLDDIIKYSTWWTSQLRP